MEVGVIVVVVMANRSRYPNLRPFWNVVGAISESRWIIGNRNSLLQVSHVSASSVGKVRSLCLTFNDCD